MGILSNPGSINTVTVHAGSILFNGAMSVANPLFTSQGAIQNGTIPVNIVTTNTAFFNALGGNVGSIASPILVNASQGIIVGSTYLADFNGIELGAPIVGYNISTYDLNPPCVVIFNGVTILDCHRPPPVPPGPPVPSTVFVITGFAAPGFENSQFNLASDYYFYPYFYDSSYFAPIPGWFMYYRIIVQK